VRSARIMSREYATFPLIPTVWIYLLCAVVLLTLGSKAQEYDFYIGMVVTEYGIVLAPVLLMLWHFRLKPRKALRLNPIGFGTAGLIALTVLFSMPIILFLNLLAIALISLTGSAFDLPIPSADTVAQLTGLFFIISVSAGICEEIFFRGMMLSALDRRYGRWVGIAGAAVLFGLFHFNPQNLLGPIFLGVLFGYLVMLTDSLFAGILGHMVNNGGALLISWTASRMMPDAKAAAQGVAMFNQNPKLAFAAVAVYGIIGTASAFMVFGLLHVIRKIESERKERCFASAKAEAAHSWITEEEAEAAVSSQPAAEGGTREKILVAVPVIAVAVIYLVVCGLILVRHTV
jgi:uncharacterized protein